MVRRMGWGGTKGQQERWGELGPGATLLSPLLPTSRCLGPGRGRISVFSMSPTPYTRNSPSLFLTSNSRPLSSARTSGVTQPHISDLSAPETSSPHGESSGTPSSAPSGLRSYSTPCLASVTPLPSQLSLQSSPGLRMGPLIPEQDYERLEDCDPDRDCDNDQDSPLPGDDQEPLLHVPEGLRGSWHHIQNLDSFFTKLYNYHQRNGFACMLLEDTFQLGQFVFVVTFTTFLLRCVDYDVLFANRPVNHTRPSVPGPDRTSGILQGKVTLSDAILPAAQCAQRIRSSSFLIFLLFLASGFWLFRLLRSLCNLLNYWDIRTFYREALHIPPEDLSKVPWAEIQSRLLALQRGGGLCVLPRPLTELDVHHRILRYPNYLVALANKGLLPARCPLPWGGSATFLSQGLALNLDLLLFRGPISLFRGGWALPSTYKRSCQRRALATRLRRTLLLLALANLALCPLVLAWQGLHAFFSHAELLRREPGALGMRRWSRLARLQLRHFNELPHELRARLARAYRPAARYLRAAAPPAPLSALLARHAGFFAGALLAVLLVLTVYDEDVLAVEHVLTAMTGLGVALTVARCFIPEEELLGRSPKSLLQAALAHMHYLPEEPGPTREANSHHQMSQLLQYKAVSLLEELLSPVLTPLALLFWFRPRALEFIDFFRHFTVDVAGVGDVCSFALMDVRRHGHPQWLSAGQTEASVSQRAEGGKTELSLMRFSLAHPRWRPPGHSSRFLEQLRDRVQQDAALWAATPIRSPPTPGQGPSFLSDSTTSSPEALLTSLLLHPLLPPRELSPVAPCPAAATASLLASLSGSTCQAGHDQSCVSPGGPGLQNPALLSELASAEMSLHAIYLHQLHQQQQQEQWGETSATPLPRLWPSPQRPLTPEDETLTWHSDGTSSSSSSPRQQWGPKGARNLPLGGWQEESNIQKGPQLNPSSG
ncbi:autophagy-related protein 9B [Dromiciops gliroides]|uniref:autophagy-related protein 9B n=1 Tax=Dromiciops gliroides TaxID=33562 RepID=UPI001CC3D3C1|nr:autophagy-related protein 9B [Dromiciops gliroides]